MPSAIEEMSRTVVQDAPVSSPADIAPPQPAAPAPAPAPEPPKPAAAPTPAPAPEKPATVTETPLSKAQAKMEKILGPDKKATKPEKPPTTDDTDEKEIKSNPKAWRIFEAKKKAWAEKEAGFTTKTAELEKKIAELSSKPNPTAADDTKLKALEARLAERENEFKSVKQKLAERDYAQSDEYAEKFVKPWNRAYADAYQYVEGLQVMDEEGNPARQATKADFDKVKSTPLQQRRAVAKALFGEDSAADVVEYAKELDRIGKASDEAIKDHAQNWEKSSQEKAMAAQKDQEGFSKLVDESRKDIETKFPDYFSVDHYKDNPELQKALADGYAEYDSIVEGFSKLPPAEQAAHNTMARAWFAAFPLMHKKLTAANTELESLKAELARYRGSDPGATAPKTGATAPVEDIGGIAAMAGKFGK